MFPSKVNNEAAMCEQASFSPAIQVQCVHTTIPFCLTAIHGLAGATDSFCECLTEAVICSEDHVIL